MISDMYDEEYFTQLIKPQMVGEKPKDEVILAMSLFYKYYSELSEEQVREFDTNNIDQRFAS